MPPELEFHKVTAKELPIVSYLCLWGVSKQQKEAMKEHMEKRIKWIKEMWLKGLKIIIALGPRQSKKGLIEYLPIEIAPEPVKGVSSLFVNCIWVLPRFKRKSIGKGLMQCFLDDARKVGGATVLSYEGDKWFSYFDYMPTNFFKKFGFKEVSRDETRVLLHLDLGANSTPELLIPKRQKIMKTDRTEVNVFCNSQCPWCGWMADRISRKTEDFEIILKQTNTDQRKNIEEFGLSRGISINGKPVIKRMASWKEVKSALETITN